MLNRSEQVKRFRMGRALTQEALAQQLGVTPMTVSRWETGRTRVPDGTLLRLARLGASDAETAEPAGLLGDREHRLRARIDVLLDHVDHLEATLRKLVTDAPSDETLIRRYLDDEHARGVARRDQQTAELLARLRSRCRSLEISRDYYRDHWNRAIHPATTLDEYRRTWAPTTPCPDDPSPDTARTPNAAPVPGDRR